MALLVSPATPRSVASTALDSEDSETEPPAPLAPSTAAPAAGSAADAAQSGTIDVASESDVEMTELKDAKATPLHQAAARSGGRQSSLLFWTSRAEGPPGKRFKRLTASEATARRRDRRERNTALRFWEIRLPPPVVGYDHQVERLCSSSIVNGLEAWFPVEPLPSQLQLLSAAVEAMEKRTVALLESPTGTGKTLALLTSSLAFQWRCFQSWQQQGHHLPPAPASRLGRKDDQAAPDGQTGTGGGPDGPAAVPRVIWIARTHDQLEHTIRELRRLPYRPLESLRISRERFCLHPFVQQAQDKSTACEMATMTRHGNALGGGMSGCVHLDNAEAIGYPTIAEHRAKFEAGGTLAVYDIEDLVKEGHDTQTCPYHASMDLTGEGAALILCTYPQIMDPCVRESSNFEQVLQDAVVVIDEAHNLPQVARDSASFRGSVVDFEQLISKLQGLAKATAEPEAVELAEKVCGAVTRLRDWLSTSAAGGDAGPIRLTPMGDELRDEGGRGCLVAWHGDDGVGSVAEAQRLLTMLRGLRRRFIEHGLEGVETGLAAFDPKSETAAWSYAPSAPGILHMSVTGWAAVNEMAAWTCTRRVVRSVACLAAVRGAERMGADPDSFLRKMSLVLEEAGSYTLVVTKAGFGQRGRLAMVALSGLVAFHNAVGHCRAVLCASGTLAPFPLFKRELGLELEGRVGLAGAEMKSRLRALRSPHVSRRLKVLAIKAVEGQKLSSTRSFRAQHGAQYLSSLAKVLQLLLPAVPHGKLIFFPSHEQLADAVNHWQRLALLQRGAAGGFDRLGGIPVVIETSGLSSEAAAALVSQYRQLASKDEGSILLAVMRGRCAEGADFKDEAARAVVVVGVPFPSMDTEVRLKMEYEGRHGSAWYEAEAYRSVSQAAGRLLRHQSDYGCLLPDQEKEPF
ncbi:Regulator of telomere elongation helicase 1 homolog [Durusdinium trenchii]|uniref:Regulator of telomere elongation helicase 1 homolog n=1 Tax=Durusdinium trenchii TaxID=1381693 RepID=A0ABP0Q3T9_9DINO